MDPRYWKSTILGLIWLLAYPSVGQTSLFLDQEPLELTLILDLKEVLNDIGEDREYHKALLLDKSVGSSDTFRIKVKTRGFMRRNPKTCSFPPLMLNFKKKSVGGTLFEGQNKLKFVTHCRPAKDNINNLFKEYLIYQQYQLLTDMSVRTRLVRMTYVDPQSKKEPYQSYGIILEHKKQMAARNGATVYDENLAHQDRCVNPTLDLFTLFQFMIGNTDWNINKAHNVYLIQLANTSQIHPVPYDFDYAGLINATYAEPDPRLPITDVRQRLFRGFCRKPGEYEQTIKIFLDRKADLYSVFEDFELLDQKERRSVINYLDKYYDIISNPKKVQTQIYGACPVKHDHLYN